MADILSLADARTALQLPTADTSRDADLSAVYIPAVTPIVEDIAGPVMQQSGLTWTTNGGYTFVSLPVAPTAVTAVTESNTTLVQNVDYVVNLRSGVVTRGSVAQPYIFLPGIQNVVVTYNQGAYATSAAVPANIKLAARIILRQMWQADQQGGRQQYGQVDADLVSTPSGFLVPRRAFELLRPTLAMPGFA